jgi:hypothetical protein
VSAPIARRVADPMCRWQGAVNRAAGEAAQQAWVAEQLRRGAIVAWSAPTANSARYNRDILDGWDTIAVTAHYTVLSQVKATARDPWPPPPIWRARFLGLPHPPALRYLLVWLTPDGAWRVWRLLADGTRLETDWPPGREARR